MPPEGLEPSRPFGPLILNQICIPNSIKRAWWSVRITSYIDIRLLVDEPAEVRENEGHSLDLPSQAGALLGSARGCYQLGQCLLPVKGGELQSCQLLVDVVHVNLLGLSILTEGIVSRVKRGVRRGIRTHT